MSIFYYTQIFYEVNVVQFSDFAILFTNEIGPPITMCEWKHEDPENSNSSWPVAMVNSSVEARQRLRSTERMILQGKGCT